MRMPLLRYFMVVGSVLVGLLFWVSNESEPNSSPLKTSQVVGVPRPFKATRPELMPDLTAVNFAAAPNGQEIGMVERPVFRGSTDSEGGFQIATV